MAANYYGSYSGFAKKAVKEYVLTFADFPTPAEDDSPVEYDWIAVKMRTAASAPHIQRKFDEVAEVVETIDPPGNDWDILTFTTSQGELEVIFVRPNSEAHTWAEV